MGVSFEFIERVVTPGAGSFSDDELSAQAEAVRVRRDAVEYWERHAEVRPFGVLSASHLQQAYEALQGAENRHALMVLHNRVLSLSVPPSRAEGEALMASEHGAMKAALVRIARMSPHGDPVRRDPVSVARRALEDLGMGWML